MKRRILSLLTALALCLGMLPTAAFAAGTGTEKAIQLVADGTAANISGGQADTLYFGNYQQSSDGSGGYSTDPIRWRVLENAGGALFLLSDQNLDVFQYNIANVTVTWATSTIRSWLNGYDASHNIGTGYAGVDYTSDNFISTAFSEGEQAAIAETNVVTADNGSVDGGEDTTDKIFLLSIEQAQTSSFFSDNSSRIATNTAYVAGGGTLDGYMNGVGEANSWWLRSPGIYAENVAYVAEGGSVYSNGGSVDNYDVAVRPAFHLGLNSVLFTSAAAGGKPEGGLQEVTEYSGNEWKLTLKDSNRNFSVTEDTASGESGGTVTLQYSGATTGTNEYISVLLTDDQGDALYYGRVVQPQTESGTVNVTIPTGLALGTYTLNVFSEQYNGDYQTDYASAFEAVSLTVTDTTAPTLSNGSATRGDSEAAATVQFTSSEAGTYYYAVVESGAEAPTIDTNGTGAACVSGENTISLDSLTGTGAKDIYIVAKDEAGNESDKLKITIPAYTAPVYSISASPTELNFDSEPEAYTEAPTAQTVTITNTGNRDITVTLPTSTNYAITAGEGFSNSTAALAPNGTATFTVQPKTGLGAGGYSETLTISGSNSVSTSVELSFTVLKSLAGAVIQVSGTYTYDGTAKQPGSENVTVTLGDETLNEDTDYTLSYSTNINAGTATVTATGMGSYSGTATGTFTINKAEPTVSGVAVSSPGTIYNSTEISNITLTHGTGDTPGTVALDAGQTLTVGEHSYSWTFAPSDTTNYTTVNGSITLTVAEDAVASIAVTTPPTKTAYTYGESLDTSGMVVTATYASGATKDVTAEVTVSPETLTTSVTALTITYGGKTTTQAITVSPKEVNNPAITLSGTSFEYTGEAITPTVVSVKDGNNVIPTSEYTVSYSNNTNVGTATVTINDVEGGNYTVSGTTTFEITKAKATVTTAPEAVTGLTYDGQAQALVTAGEATGGTMQYSTDGSSYSAAIPTDTAAGEYTVWYYVKGDDNHSDSDPVEVKVSIAKAMPSVDNVAVSNHETLYDTTDFASITLTCTGTAGTVTLDAGQTLTVGENSYSWTFTPDDTANYTTVNGSITLTVEEDAVQSITVTKAPTKTTYTYGDKLDLSGMVVTAAYASGATKDVTGEVTVSPETLTTSVTALTITYGGKTATQTITVNPATISIASATVQDKTYDGSEDATVTSVEFTGLVNDESLTSGADYTATAEFTDKSAGGSKQATVTVTLTNGNYTFGTNSSTTTATASIKPLQVELSWNYDGPFTYDGEEHSVDASISNTVEGDIISLSYGSSTIAATNAGTYTATVSALTGDDAGNYTLGGVQNLSLAWSIGSASIANATVELSKTEFTYNGQSQTPTVTVKLGGNTLTANTDYTVTFSGNSTDAGTYTVTVTGAGNCTGTATDKPTYTITPAALTIAGVTLTAKTYDGTNTATVESVTFDGFTLAKDTDYTAAAVYDSADAGTNRTATVTVELKNTNFTLTDNTFHLTGQTIAQADFDGTTGISGTVLANWPGEVTLPAIPNDAKYGTPTSDAVTNMSIADGVLSYTGGSGITAGDTYAITVPVSGSVNYLDYTITVTLTGTDKQALTITGVQAAAGLVYTGQAQTGYTGTPSAQGYTGDFTVIYNTADQKAPINAGTYTVTIAIPDSDPQYVGSTTLEFVIARKPLTVAAPDLSVYVGSTAPELALVYNGLVTGENVTPSAAPTFVITKSDGSEIALADAVKTAGTYTITWSNADGTTFPDGGNYAITLDNEGTLTVSTRSSGGGSSSSSGTTTETEKNPDGSTTTTVTKPDGSTTETTKYPDGSKEVVETAKDGTVTTTTTDTAGNKTEVVENTDGSSKTTVDNKDGSGSVTLVDENGQVVSEATLSQAAVEAAQEKGEAVALPMPSVPVTTDRETAATVTVDLPSGTSAKVEIPVENVTSGTVAVIVKADGTEEVIKTSLTTENGVAVTLSDGDTVKIVDNSKAFDDVSDGYWAAEMIDFATSRELFAGTSETTFSPNTAMSRAMIVTVLARFDGVDTTTGSTWYEAGQQWAIANGVSDGTNMDQGLSREQLATMLWRYAGNPVASADMSGYTDAGTVSSYAQQAMAWCVEQGIIGGITSTTLSPQAEATRAQVATMLMRFIESIA